MKTASTVKYSRLNTLYGNYEKYEQQCAQLYEKYRKEFNDVFCFNNTNAPVCYIVIGANQGMCGAFNSELLNFFESIIESEENPHLSKINSVLAGKEVMAASESEPDRQTDFKDNPTYTAMSEGEDKNTDAYLCQDALQMEKHVSSIYDTVIFECTTQELRDLLAEIQRDEQNHGKRIYDYMAANGMYS